MNKCEEETDCFIAKFSALWIKPLRKKDIEEKREIRKRERWKKREWDNWCLSGGKLV